MARAMRAANFSVSFFDLHSSSRKFFLMMFASHVLTKLSWIMSFEAVEDKEWNLLESARIDSDEFLFMVKRECVFGRNREREWRSIL